jgi:hypothetical protein
LCAARLQLSLVLLKGLVLLFCPELQLSATKRVREWRSSSVESLADGSLSLANHFETDDDALRRDIKIRMNDFLGR